MLTCEKKFNPLKKNEKTNMEKAKTSKIKAKSPVKTKLKPAINLHMGKKYNSSKSGTIKNAEKASVPKKNEEKIIKKQDLLPVTQKAEEGIVFISPTITPDQLKENINESQRLGFTALLDEAKNKGYLVHEDLINLLPNDYADPTQIESIISRLAEMGIKVFEIPPDADSLLLEEDTQSDDEINEDVAEVLATETRTTDPVRMYMREMGSIELLTREGEIVIAKRIEEGVRQVMGAVVQYPELIESFIKEYETIVATEGRLSDLLIRFFDEEEGGGEESADEFGESGPDPVVTQKHMEEFKALYSRYLNAIKHYGKKAHATLRNQRKLAEFFSTFKLSIRQFNRLIGRLRRLLKEARDHERLIMTYCVVKAKTPRKKFIASFPHNETNMNWLEQYKKGNKEQAKQLELYSKEIYRAQRNLAQLEEKK